MWNRLRTPLASLPATAVWLTLGLATAALYATQFLLPFGLLRWLPVPEQTLGKIAGSAPADGLRYLAVFASLFVLYWAAYRHAGRHHGARDWGLVLASLVTFNLILAMVYPIDAADVFDGIMRGRMLAWHGANPFYQVPNDFSADPIFPYVAWRTIGSAWGPLWELIAAALAWLGGPDVLTTVLVYKAGSIAAYAASLALIVAWQRRAAPDRALASLVLFGWCPLVLYTTAEGAHNDPFMIAPMLLAFVLLQRGHPRGAVWALVAGALVKYIPLMLVPLVLAYVYRQCGLPPFGPAQEQRAPDAWRHFARYVVTTAAGALVLVGAAYAPFWQGGDILGAARRGEMFTSSVPAMVRAALITLSGQTREFAGLVARGLAIASLGVAGLVAIASAFGRTLDAPTRAARNLLLFYLLVACLWLQPWYVGWPLALAALLPEDHGTRATALLAFTLLCKVLVFEFLLMPGGVGPPEAVRELYVAPLLLGPVWLYLGAGALRRLRRRFARPV